jgi:murein L,D-transpeptidase YcbB/YkuD
MNPRDVLRGTSCLAILVSLAACGRTDHAVGKEIAAAVSFSKRPPSLPGARWTLLRQVYRDRRFAPLWTNDGKPTAQVGQLIATLCGAERDGLRPGDYDLADLKQAIQRAYAEKRKPTAGALAALDLELTARFLDYGADLLVGRLAPAAVDSGWFIRARRSSADSLLRVAARGRDLAGMLGPLRSRRADYDELVKALETYRGIQRAGGWPRVPAGPDLVRGGRGRSVAALRKRLEIGGDLAQPKEAKPVFNGAVAAAVARFQKRHGIPVDSTISPATLLALNTPVDYWIRQIEINLERYRWLPRDFGKRYILVNIPDYHLYAFDGGRRALEMRVIVGDQYGNATPVFADSMSYLVFRPRWYLPRRILVDEVIPQVRQNIFYLAENHFEVVDAKRRSTILDPASIDWAAVDTTNLPFRVRQRAGESNSLGLVKFMFPNQFSVYLHDTPAGWLFRQQRRALSHGCVRVERPVELADFVLAGQDGWSDSTIRTAMGPPDTMPDSIGPSSDTDTTEGRTVRLEHKVPVYILYLTAYVEDGVLNFRGDPYGKDAQAQERLGKPKPADGRLCREIAELLPR